MDDSDLSHNPMYIVCFIHACRASMPLLLLALLVQLTEENNSIAGIRRNPTCFGS